MTQLARLEIEQRGEVSLARIDGEVDISNAADLRERLGSAASNAAAGMVLDLSRTTYLDSAGVHVLFWLAERFRRRQQQFRLVVPEGATLMQVLEVSELPEVLPLHRSAEEAVAAVMQQDASD